MLEGKSDAEGGKVTEKGTKDKSLIELYGLLLMWSVKFIITQERFDSSAESHRTLICWPSIHKFI